MASAEEYEMVKQMGIDDRFINEIVKTARKLNSDTQGESKLLDDEIFIKLSDEDRALLKGILDELQAKKQVKPEGDDKQRRLREPLDNTNFSVPQGEGDWQLINNQEVGND